MYPRTPNPCAYMAATKTLKVMGSRWKVLILWKLIDEGSQRYSELKEALCSVSEKMLSQVLKEMKEDQLIEKKIVIKKAPQVVYYSISPLGKELRPAIQALIDFGHRLP